MSIYKPGHLLFMFLFVIFAVVLGRFLLLGSPLARVPGAKTIGAAL